MEIQHRKGPNQGMFYIEEEGKRLAAIVYDKAGQTLVIEHTEVDKALRGNRIGYRLVQHTVDYARQEGFKVSPVCPFAKALFAQKPDWNDVLAA